jgi:GT2 family glycosyltransferase
MEGGLVETDRIGCAVMLLSRHAANKAVANAQRPENLGMYRRGSMTIYDVFQVGVRDGEYLSEDYFLCRTLREAGLKIYYDPQIPVKHNGMTAWQ